MKSIYKPGDRISYSYKVLETDIASFKGEVVHKVCSTFALAREIEWSTRLFVLDMKEDDEEGVGTRLEIKHKGPAFVGETLQIDAVVVSIIGNELICDYEAKVGERLVATGTTGQRILLKQRIQSAFAKAQNLDK